MNIVINPVKTNATEKQIQKMPSISPASNKENILEISPIIAIPNKDKIDTGSETVK